jgi:hypothetical protein
MHRQYDGGYLVRQIRKKHDYLIQYIVDLALDLVASRLHDVVAERAAGKVGSPSFKTEFAMPSQAILHRKTF